MKNFAEFEAFRLNKVQMNAIAGGSIYCVDDFTGENITFSDGISMEEAYKSASQILDNPVCETEIKA